jgi:glycosyltransferase involved in cell wall biosynthesis
VVEPEETQESLSEPSLIKPMHKIFILIRSLHAGGAERQVYTLAKALHQRGYFITVGVFYSGGVFEKQLRLEGIPVYDLQKKSRWDVIGWFFRYLKAVKEVRPDVIYSFLTVSNIIAVTGKLFVSIPVVWGIRASNMCLKEYDWLARLSAFIEKKLSIFPSKIIYNANSGLLHCQELGYRTSHCAVIPNGINTEIFKPDIQSVKQTKKSLHIPQSAILVGMVARYDPMKDYETFYKVALSLTINDENIYFIAVGLGTSKAANLKNSERIIVLESWENISEIYNALNILILSSAFGEGFPNVVGEAMACGVPVIATDVGDCAHIIEDCGIVVPVKNPEAIVQAIERILAHPYPAEKIRRRIVDNFSVECMVDKTLTILTSAVSRQ